MFNKKFIVFITAFVLLISLSNMIKAESIILADRDINDELHDYFTIELNELEAEEKEEVNLPQVFTTENITTPTGLTGDDFNKLIENTPLKGMGETIVSVENEYNINGLFLLSVANIESGMGRASRGYNLFGMIGRKHQSYKHSMIEFAKLINKSYAGMSIKSLAKKYCPPNHSKWVIALNNTYNKFRGILNV